MSDWTSRKAVDSDLRPRSVGRDVVRPELNFFEVDATNGRIVLKESWDLYTPAKIWFTTAAYIVYNSTDDTLDFVFP